MTVSLIRDQRYRKALDDLELYAVSNLLYAPQTANSDLPASPFQENPTLHMYAGLLNLYLSQGDSYGSEVSSRAVDAAPSSIGEQSGKLLFVIQDLGLAYKARGCFEKALTLDPKNPAAIYFLDNVSGGVAIALQIYYLMLHSSRWCSTRTRMENDMLRDCRLMVYKTCNPPPSTHMPNAGLIIILVQPGFFE
jgi:hypothetical protein